MGRGAKYRCKWGGGHWNSKRGKHGHQRGNTGAVRGGHLFCKAKRFQWGHNFEKEIRAEEETGEARGAGRIAGVSAEGYKRRGKILQGFTQRGRQPYTRLVGVLAL